MSTASSAVSAPTSATPASGAAGYSAAQLQFARIRLGRFAWLLAQLALLLFIFHAHNVQSRSFFLLSCLTFGGFVLHYFTPLAWKRAAFILLSLLCGYVMVAHADPWASVGIVQYVATGIFLVGLLLLAVTFWAVLNAPLPFSVRIGVVLAITGVLGYARVAGDLLSDAQWRVLGGLFMFRMFLYVYEIWTRKQRQSLQDFSAYFLLLPNFHFNLFPVIDYDTFKKSWFSADIHETAQRGIDWMVRGTIQLCLFRLIYHRVAIGPDQVVSLLTLCQFIFPAYLMYMQVSGQFHIIIGMLHLFGWRLPETNRNYLLAESFTDFWRRINIYWKDFMVKCFYYPTYFRLRKTNEKLALVTATLVVFIVTTLLHGYQTFWLLGSFRVSGPDAVFWGTLGVLVLFGVLRQSAKRAKQPPQSAWYAGLRRVLSTLGVYVFISVLWSMWSSPSLTDWWDAVAFWKRA